MTRSSFLPVAGEHQALNLLPLNLTPQCPREARSLVIDQGILHTQFLYRAARSAQQNLLLKLTIQMSVRVTCQVCQCFASLLAYSTCWLVTGSACGSLSEPHKSHPLGGLGQAFGLVLGIFLQKTLAGYSLKF